MNKNELINYIAMMTTLPKTDSKVVIEAMIQGILEGLETDGKVILVGFGTFSLVRRAARMARNPRTGEQVQVEEKTVIKFKAAKNLKENVQ